MFLVCRVIRGELIQPIKGMEMKSGMMFVMGMTLLFGSGAVAFAQQQTFTGTVTDSMCGATHMAKDKSPAECTRMCVKDELRRVA